MHIPFIFDILNFIFQLGSLLKYVGIYRHVVPAHHSVDLSIISILPPISLTNKIVRGRRNTTVRTSVFLPSNKELLKKVRLLIHDQIKYITLVQYIMSAFIAVRIIYSGEFFSCTFIAAKRNSPGALLATKLIQKFSS